MPACIGFKDQFFWVASERLADLLKYGVEVGLKTAADDQERAWANGLHDQIPELCRRNELAVETAFPSYSERKFWTRVFYDLSYMVFRREIGGGDPAFQDCTAVADADLIGDMISHSVPWKEERENWDLMTMAGAEIKKLEEKRW